MNKEDGYLTYLGDGVYATFDGYQIWLKTQYSDRTHVVALEPATQEALNNYIEELKRQLTVASVQKVSVAVVDNEG